MKPFLLKQMFLSRRIPWPSQGTIVEDEVKNIISDTLRKTMPKPVHTGRLLEEYNVKEYVKVMIDEWRGRLRYLVVEPTLNPTVEEAVSRLFLINPECTSQYCLARAAESSGDQWLIEALGEYPAETTYYYLKVTSGYGIIYPLVIDPWVEEIAGSTGDGQVSIIHRKYTWYGWLDTNLPLTEGEADRIVLSLARRAGRHISLAQPIAEGLTPEGLRVSLTFGREVSRKGSSFTLRKRPPRIITITELIDKGVISAVAVAYLWLILELKGFILIIGGMSTGKTTMLQALLTLIPPTRRIVTIEDTPEIMGATAKWDPLVERPSFSNTASIDLFKLLKFSLRRRADYIVVGEVRGREARLLVQASRLGHGILATMHGEDAETVLERLTAPPISIPRSLLSNIWSILLMESEGGVRRARRIYEVEGKTVRPILDMGPNTTPTAKQVAEKSGRLRKVMEEEEILDEIAGRAAFLQELANKGVSSPDLLGEEIVKYYLAEAVEPDGRKGA
jgi:flagellar protein FlaI